VHRALVQHPVLQLAVRASQSVRRALADRVGRAGTERDAEQIARELDDPPPRDTVRGGQRHQRRLQPRPERRPGNVLRQASAGPRAAVPAAQLMRAMLAEENADRRQLSDPMATKPTTRPLLLRREPATAAATHPRVMIDDLIHLIRRLQLTTRATMPRLPTLRSPLTPFAHQLLRLRPRLRTPLRARFGRILRRRLRTRARILPPLLLQPPQPLLVLLDPARQLENELNTRLTPRVIHRLRLGTIHACKIRCTNKESLPQAPTTERLPFAGSNGTEMEP
jgi:hypothetical protein